MWCHLPSFIQRGAKGVGHVAAGIADVEHRSIGVGSVPVPAVMVESEVPEQFGGLIPESKPMIVRGNVDP